jgi:nitroreductase
MDIGTLERLIKGRRSVRRWKKDEVRDDLLRKAIELATWAPNGGNFQGWRFIVVKNRELIEKMADAVQSVADKAASWPEAKPWQEDLDRYRRNTSLFRNAPVCIGVFVGEYQSPIDKVLIKREPFDPEAKEILASRRSAPTALQSAAAAVTTMLLTFHQMGLGALWMASPLQARNEIEKMLKAPSNLSLVCVVAVGYPDEVPEKDRKPVDQVLEFIR